MRAAPVLSQTPLTDKDADNKEHPIGASEARPRPVVRPTNRDLPYRSQTLSSYLPSHLTH